ncbi:cbb3-type cytochrome oxidase assembly protein CcoS [Olivibacter ginsenosidimutans]|uniref:Cbb3-type cytochrome oxidase assembly protein CcoS n=1 Tax=Olivibacter ginsenosidimutans TaxID=1176537 RepID=A0ABP9BI25_9SPHI
MSVLFFLIGCSVCIALFFLVAFFWASKNGQHEDTYTPSIRILFEDEISASNPDDAISNEDK